MQEIAIVQKQRVGTARPRRCDLFGKGCKAQPALRSITTIVPAERMSMQIGRRKQSQGGMNL